MSISGSGNAADRERVLAIQRKRWEFLRYLYDQLETIPSGHLQSSYAFEVGTAIGVTDRREVDRIFTYLKDAGLIKFMSMGPNVAITRAGIDTVERALANPDQPTPYFGPVNVLMVSGGMHGSVVQQGTQSSTQNVSAAPVDLNELRALFPRLRAEAENLSGDDAAVASAEISTAEAQTKSPSPRLGTIRESLLSLRSIFENAGGNVAGEALSTWLRAQGWL